MKEVINNIKALRLAKGLTQKQLAELLGITTQGYQKIESGENDLNLTRLAQIADVHGVSVLSLFEGTEKTADVEALENRIKELERELDLVKREKDVAKKEKHLLELDLAQMVAILGLIKFAVSENPQTVEMINVLQERLTENINKDVLNNNIHSIMGNLSEELKSRTANDTKTD